jgi:hypothetical protein
VAFDSEASDLVAGDNNDHIDVFVRDRVKGETIRVSLSESGEQGNGDSRNPSLSADGRFVAFHSHASNLVANDNNDAPDAFLYDRLTQKITRISVSTEGWEGNGSSNYPHLSANGRFATFQCGASNLVPDDTNQTTDIVVRELPLYELYFAQIGEGANLLFSQVILMNLDLENVATAGLWLRDSEGEPLSLDLNGEVVTGEAQFQIPAGGLKVLRTDGFGEVVHGSVRVNGDRPLAGVILFGGVVGVAGVGNSLALEKGCLAPMENSSAEQIRAGIAVMNLMDVGVTAHLELLDNEGVLVATLPDLEVAALGQVAKYLDELFPGVDLSEFQGILRITGTGTIAAMVIQTRPGHFATMPVVPN